MKTDTTIKPEEINHIWGMSPTACNLAYPAQQDILYITTYNLLTNKVKPPF